MRSRAIYFHGTLFVLLLFLGTEATAQNPSSKPANQAHKPVATVDSGIDPGAITHGVYRNKTLALTCKIPQGWVLRTEEMNAHDAAKTSKDSVQPPEPTTGTGRVLLAAFSRPPEARGEDVNSSILIAAEST